MEMTDKVIENASSFSKMNWIRAGYDACGELDVE